MSMDTNRLVADILARMADDGMDEATSAQVFRGGTASAPRVLAEALAGGVVNEVEHHYNGTTGSDNILNNLVGGGVLYRVDGESDWELATDILRQETADARYSTPTQVSAAIAAAMTGLQPSSPELASAASVTGFGYIKRVASATWSAVSSIPWADLVGIPTISAGNGLTGGGSLVTAISLAVAFAGSGIANTVSRSDHRHDLQYVELDGSNSPMTGALESPNFIGGSPQGGNGSGLITKGAIAWYQSSRAVNSRWWDMISDVVSGELRIRALDDSGSALATPIKFSRSGDVVIGGAVTANSYAVVGGTSAGFLKANGTVDTTSYLAGNQTITLSGDATGSGSTSISVSVVQAAKWTTPRTITIGGTGKSLDGSTNVSWSVAEIGALPASGGIINRIPKWASSSSLANSLMTDDGSTVFVAGELSVSSAIKMTGSGFGTYNTGAIFCDGAGINIARPRVTDSGSAAIRSFSVGQRGGGTWYFEVGDGTTYHRQPVVSTSHLTLNGATRQSWGSGRNATTLGGTISIEQVNSGGDYWIVHNNCYFDGTNNRSISATGYASQFLTDPSGNMSFYALPNNGVNGIISFTTKQFNVDASGNGSFTGNLTTADVLFLTRSGSGTYNRGMLTSDSTGLYFERPHASDSSASAILSFSVSQRGGGTKFFEVADGTTYHRQDVRISTLTMGGILKADPVTGQLKIAVADTDYIGTIVTNTLKWRYNSSDPNFLSIKKSVGYGYNSALIDQAGSNSEICLRFDGGTGAFSDAIRVRASSVTVNPFLTAAGGLDVTGEATAAKFRAGLTSGSISAGASIAPFAGGIIPIVGAWFGVDGYNVGGGNLNGFLHAGADGDSYVGAPNSVKLQIAGVTKLSVTSSGVVISAPYFPGSTSTGSESYTLPVLAVGEERTIYFPASGTTVYASASQVCHYRSSSTGGTLRANIGARVDAVSQFGTGLTTSTPSMILKCIDSSTVHAIY